MVIPEAPCFAATLISSLFLPATQIRGSPTGFGSQTASLKFQYLPSKFVVFSVHSDLTICSVSSSRSTRSLNGGNLIPAALNSASSYPIPIASSTLPFETSEAVATIFARRPGLRKELHVARLPIRTFLVRALSAEIVVQHSRIGVVPLWMWSGIHNESNPRLSACRAASASLW